MLSSVHTVVERFEFGGRDVAAVLVEAAMVEPVHPFQGGDFDVFCCAPWPAGFDQLGFVEPVDRLGEGVVETVAGAAYRGVDPRLEQSVGEGD